MGTTIPVNVDIYKQPTEDIAKLRNVQEKSLQLMERVHKEEKAAIDRSNQLAMQDLRLQELMYPKKTRDTDKKLSKTYDKWLNKGNIFPMLAKGLKNMAQGAASFFGRFLKMLLMLSILGPEFANGIIDLFIGLIVTIIRFIKPFIKPMLKTFWNLLTVKVPQAIETLIREIVPVIGDALQEMLKGTKLEWLGNKFKEWFGDKGMLTEFFVKFGKILPLIVGALWLFTKLLTPLKILGSIFSGIGKAIFSIIKFAKPEWIAKIGAKGLGSVVSNLIGTAFKFLVKFLPGLLTRFAVFAGSTLLRVLTGPVGIIATILQVVWMFSEEIEGFLDNVPKWLEDKLGFVGKILGNAFRLFMMPIKIIISLMNALKKVVKEAGGWGKFFGNIWQGIKNWFKGLFDPILKWVGDRITAFKKTGIGKVFTSIFEVLEKVAEMIKNTLMPVFDKLKFAFNFFSSLLKGIFADPSGFLLNKETRAKVLSAAQASAEAGYIADIAARSGDTKAAESASKKQKEIEDELADKKLKSAEHYNTINNNYVLAEKKYPLTKAGQ